MNHEKRHIIYFTPKFPTQESISVLQCGYEESLPGHSSTQKTLDHYVLHCITSGKGIYTVNNKTYSLEKGDCFLLLPDVPIFYQADARDPWIYYWIGFTGADISHLLSLCITNETIPVAHFGETEKIADHISSLIDSDPRLLSDNYYALGQLYCIFSLLIKPNDSDQPLQRREFYINQAIAYIKDNLSNNISVQDIARHVGLDRTYLYRIFKETTGMSIQSYIQHTRLEKACHLLKCSNLSSSQIALLCGYSSAQHFSSCFKKETGLSPSKYRKQ
jgi:AraC-like DNA-binding protein